MEQVLSILKSFGISPDKITPELIDKITNMGLDFNNTDSFTTEKCNELIEILGLELSLPKKKVKNPRIGMNATCPCGSKIKYKKCCRIKEIQISLKD
jgi:uncharacterized protein YecA (UPF0149 family)